MNGDGSDAGPAVAVTRRVATPAATRRTVGRRIPVIAIIALSGVLLTALASWTAWRLDRSSERRLLQVQTRQAAIVVAGAIVSIQSPLQTAASVATVSGGDPSVFRRFMAGYLGPERPFVSATLWRLDGARPALVEAIGVAPALAQSSEVARAFITLAGRSSTFVVTSVSIGSVKRIGYALADRAEHRFAVYAERAIPTSRRVPVESSPAFAELHFATYLGTITDAGLQTTDLPDDRLPLSGATAREAIPFGNTSIILVTSPIGHLGGALGSRLPWIFLIVGGVLTVASAAVADQLVRRRRKAEDDSATISTLYAELDGLFGEQRSISETLQNALLPQRNPSTDSLEIASRYVAGARGVEIGGDWYSLVLIGDNQFAFVVGDVSGQGVDAAVLMARVRFTLSAYLIEGHPPDKALELCAPQVDITKDGHIVTALVGCGDLTTGRLVLANAGHLNPLLLDAGRAEYIATHVGVPLGVAASRYTTTAITMPAGSVLLAFTDGLVERRDEDLGLGLNRLAATARQSGPVEELLTHLLAAMNEDASEDDIAILAFRWQPVGPGDPNIDADGDGAWEPTMPMA